MMFRHTALVVCVALFAGCAANAPAPTAVPARAGPPANDNLNAVAWTQTAVEHDLIYLQTYRDAQSRLLGALHDSRWDALSGPDRTVPASQLPPAVILDIDETVLDNSPYQARVIKRDGEFNEADWAAWCRESQARALPGAVAFTRFAASHGIAVIYLSNRAKDLDAVTINNLRQVGFPVRGPEAFLGMGTVVRGCHQSGTDKGCRREQVGRRYRVLMQFGDQLGDFIDVAVNSQAERRQAIAPYLPWIGTRWFVFPNATYGSWESALIDNNWHEPRTDRRERKLDALLYQ